jgi:hypothetical protein
VPGIALYRFDKVESNRGATQQRLMSFFLTHILPQSDKPACDATTTNAATSQPINPKFNSIVASLLDVHSSINRLSKRAEASAAGAKFWGERRPMSKH